MDDEAQADAYARADFAEVNQSFVDQLVESFPEIAEGHVVDLGCGPADILIRLAHDCPKVTSVGVDGAEAMLALGRKAIDAKGLKARIRLVRGLLPGADVSPGFDAVISNSILHHLADPSVLWRETKRLGRPGAAVYMADLSRPVSKADAERIVDAYAKDEHPILKVDFFNSLLAAFTPDEVSAQLAASGLGDLTVSMVSDRHLVVKGRLPDAGAAGGAA